MMQPKTTQVGTEYHYLGIGVIEDQTLHQINFDRNFVLLKVLAIQKIASSLVNVGQIVLWPKYNLAIPPQLPTQSSNQDNTVHVPASQDGQDPQSQTSEDGLMNYALQCIQLGVFLMQLNDTEKGDGERCLMNWKLLMLYFRSRLHSMKYAFEAMRLITCTKALFTEQLSHRIIHGQFVNVKGGIGNNYANDLKMENIVKNHKVVLKGLCGNKTLNAIQRSTSAAYGLKNVVDAIDKASHVPPDSTQHSQASSNRTIEEMNKTLQKVQPFQNQPRSLRSFPNITKSPLQKLNVTALHKWLTAKKKKLATNAFEVSEDLQEDGNSPEQNEAEDSLSETDEEVEVFIV